MTPWRTVITVACMSVGLAPTVWSDEGAPVASRQAVSAATEDIAGAIADLDHPRFERRDAATRKLIASGPAILQPLADAYREATSLEAKRRIRHVAEAIFCYGQIAGRIGFIGISLSMQAQDDFTDPKDGRLVRGIGIITPLPDLPADRAGLRSHDIIIGINGQDLPQGPMPAQLIATIEKHRPGDRIPCRLLRPSTTLRLVQIRLNGQTDPADLGLDLQTMLDGLISGPRVVKVQPGSVGEKAGLGPNTLITVVNGHRVVGRGSPRLISDLMRATAPGDPIEFAVQDMAEHNVVLEVVVRPLDYVTVADRVAARKGFLEWWQAEDGSFTARPPRRMPTFPRRQSPIAPVVPAIHP